MIYSYVLIALNNSLTVLGEYELLLETKAIEPTEYIVKDINSYRAISVMSVYSGGILGNTVVPISIYKNMAGKCVQSGFGTAYVAIVDYVSNTKMNAYVGGQNASNCTCKVYGIK